MLILIIAGGPDKGRIYELTDGEPIVLGREGDQVKLSDRKVSREHARLWCEGGQWYLQDLGSRHGTYRNHTELGEDKRAKVKDGDYLQIGNTVMVLGRMPAEHAEKLALLAGQNERATSTWRKPALIAGGVSVAALLGLGGFIAIQVSALRDQTVPREEFAQLEQQLVEAQRKQADRIDESFNRQGSINQEQLTRHQQLMTTLDDTSRKVTDAADAFENATDPIINKLDGVNTIAANQQLAIERLGEMLAHQQANDNSRELLAAVTDMKALLADQPNGDALAAKLEETIKTNAAAAGEAVRLALAEHERTTPQTAEGTPKDTEALLAKLMARLDDVPTRAQVAEEVRLAMAESSAQNEQFMRLMVAELRQTGDQITTDVAAAIDEDATRAEQIASDLRATDNESAARTASLLEAVLEKVNQQQALATQIAELREQIVALPGRDNHAVRDVLTRLDAQDQNNAAMLSAIADLRAAMPNDLPGRLDEVLTQLDKQVRTEQITDVIEKSMLRIAATRDEQTQTALAELTQRLDALPSSDQLAEVMDSQEALAKLLDQSDARGAVGELRTSLEQLAKQLPESGDDKLSQVISMLKQREKTDLMLAELHDAMGTQSDQTESLKKELLAAIQEGGREQSDETLRELLGLVRDRLATNDSVRQAIRDEIRGSVLPNQMGVADARDVSSDSNAGTSSHATEQALPRQRLTQLESAYKKSFETDQPVTVGAGIVDPNTGAISEGRLIDPAVAKALGFETWRDWYLADRHAQQMRLQQQALRDRNRLDAENTGTITLPSVDTQTDSNRPEQD